MLQPTRSTLLYSAATGLWGQRQETTFYVSSAADYPATEWAAAIRGHWGIENRNHYVRDVSCNEDQSRIWDNPGIMARPKLRPQHPAQKQHHKRGTCTLVRRSQPRSYPRLQGNLISVEQPWVGLETGKRPAKMGPGMGPKITTNKISFNFNGLMQCAGGGRGSDT